MNAAHFIINYSQFSIHYFQISYDSCMKKYTLLLLFLFLLTNGRLTHAQSDSPYRFEPAECSFVETSFIDFIDANPEDEGYECGFVIVPELHAEPDGATVRLPVAILRATNPSPAADPLFVAQGGPGGSGLDLFPFTAAYSSIAADRDIVMFNQRGTLASEPALTCPETLVDVDTEGMSDDEIDALALDQIRACHDRLVGDGVNLSAYNSFENANDVEAIREALGYETYNFYGVSYGTLLGFHLMRQHPERLRSVVLDGVVPPNINFIPEVPINENNTYDLLFAACADDPICNAEYPNLEARLFALVDQLNADPLTLKLEDGETGETAVISFDGSSLTEFLFQTFYLSQPFTLFPRIVADIEAGDVTTLEQYMSLFSFDRTFAEGMYYSVICSEDADFTADDVPLDGLRPHIVENVADDLESYIDACEIWQVETLPDSIDDAVHSDVPTLLLSGAFDPVTPARFADEAIKTLTQAYHIVDPIASHGTAFNDACADQIVLDFLNNPASEPDSSCLSDDTRRSDIVPANWVTLPFIAPMNQMGTGFLIEIGAATLLLSFLMFAFFVWPLVWFIRHLRHISFEWQPRQKWLRWGSKGLLFLFVAGAIVFITAVSSSIFYFMFGDPNPLNINAMPPIMNLFLIIPWLLLLLTVGMGITAVFLWRDNEQPLWERIYYTMLLITAVCYLFILNIHGFF